MTRTRSTLLLSLLAVALLAGRLGREAAPEAAAASRPLSSVTSPGTGGTMGSAASSPTGGVPSIAEGAQGSVTSQPGRASTPAPALPPAAPRANLVPEQPRPHVQRASGSGFLVALDPGHGGDESGAAAYSVVERDSNLDLALRVGEFLKAAGVQVHYTRTDNGRASGTTPGTTPGSGGFSTTRNDLQARVGAANRAGADVFVSLHSNGSGDPSLRGVEVYYESRRPFAEENYRLAQHLLDGALRGLTNAGHPSPNRGIIDSACWRNFQGLCVGLFVLSPGGTTTTAAGVPTGQAKEATNMPAALLETLFVSSPDDAALLRSDAVRTSIARGIADGILRYLGVAG